MKPSLIVCFCLLLTRSVIGLEIYVATDGKDANRGTRDAPLASLEGARDFIKSRNLNGTASVTVHVADGVYYLPKTLIFHPEDSGASHSQIVYRSENEGGAVLSGGTVLNLAWSKYRDGIFQASTPDGVEIDQLFVDGKNQRMARYPNFDANKKSVPYQGFAADAFSKERAANWGDPTGGYIHAMHRAGWGGYHYLITGKNLAGEVTYEGGWQNNRRMGMHQEHRMVENIFEELDAPGEWFHNPHTSILYYKPQVGVDLSESKIEVVRLPHLVQFQGSEESPVHHITFQGFKIKHAARTFMECREPLLRSDWAIYRGGAFMLTGTEDLEILDCEFDQVGGNAIFVDNYNRRVHVKGCHIHDTGASGICFVGDSDAVREPLFEYGQKNDLATIDRTPGPRTNNYPSQSVVEDCLIHGIGRVERQPAGVQIAMASEITIRDCSIYETARAGINIGDGAWGGHVIERCDVFDTVLETHDHGSFNSWGRDRYWRSDHLTESQKAVDADPDLPFLDAQKTTIIRDSRWRCDHGWDIDLDDGSSNYDIYNNLLLNTGLKLREGFRRRAWNNVMPVGSLHPHVWFKRSKDQVHSNIMAARHRTARMNEEYREGTIVDRNLYDSQDEGLMDHAAILGWDKHSMLGKPMYVDPKNGDFRVQAGSPALKLGFKNFWMDQFGVKKKSLKAIARTPLIPSIDSQRNSESFKRIPAPRCVWFGVTLTNLGSNEFSAYGVSKDQAGVVVVDVPIETVGRKSGLRSGDLILGVDGVGVATLSDLFQLLSNLESDSLQLQVIRNQMALELTVIPELVMVTETTDTATGFSKLNLSLASNRKIIANRKTANDPLTILTDGKLDRGYGPVFPNAIHSGAYRMDLGSNMAVSAVTSWSFNQGGSRVAQRVTVFGSDSPTDPGWDMSKFTAIGSIFTTDTEMVFLAASLRARQQQALGRYRWIIWSVAPVSNRGGGENTSFQELAVEVLSEN